MERKKSVKKDAGEHRKTMIAVALIVVVAIIIAGGMINLHLEREREDEEGVKARLHAEIEYWKWEIKWEQAAIAAYEEYINDNETMDAFYTLRAIDPFLKNQMPHLREYMEILHDNVTMENYETAYNQFIVCYTMDKSYSENYSFYFQQIDDKYENMSWIAYRSVPYINQCDNLGSRYYYLFAIESDYDDAHDDGFELEYYTDELEYYEEQIDYIYDILREV